jgi:hypothetical protein
MRARPQVQYTSLDAYLSITPKHLCHAQKMVHEAIARMGEATDKDIADRLRWPINRVTPRRGELQSMNRIRCIGERKDDQTGRRMMIWKVL